MKWYQYRQQSDWYDTGLPAVCWKLKSFRVQQEKHTTCKIICNPSYLRRVWHSSQVKANSKLYLLLKAQFHLSMYIKPNQICTLEQKHHFTWRRFYQILVLWLCLRQKGVGERLYKCKQQADLGYITVAGWQMSCHEQQLLALSPINTSLNHLSVSLLGYLANH